MNDEKFDALFKESIEKINEIPEGVNWNTIDGWNDYSATYYPRNKFIKLYKYAAVLVIIFISILLLNKSSKIEYTEVSTGKGEKTKVKLSNGSVIWLNSNTKIMYPEKYSKKTIEIFVEGEAYFELAEKRKNPIIIVSGNTYSHVYESSFNIRSIQSENNVEITVTKGNIEIENKNENYLGSLKFSEGERASIHKSNKLIFGETNPDKNVIAWKTGKLEFNEIPLFYVIKKLEQIYNTQIAIENANIESCKITLSFEKDNIEYILNKIAETTYSKVEKNETGFTIYNGSCNNKVKI